tara:strand:- start:933 stop:1067 length:135 start_codon:yes stop_codon:yes gene_type:complete
MGVLQTVNHSEKWKMWVVSNWIKAQKLYPSKPIPSSSTLTQSHL